jgi:hypothetical protein
MNSYEYERKAVNLLEANLPMGAQVFATLALVSAIRESKTSYELSRSVDKFCG